MLLLLNQRGIFFHFKQVSTLILRLTSFWLWCFQWVQMTKRCYPGLYKWPDVKDYKIRTFHSIQLKSLKPKTCWLIIDLCTLLRWFYFYEKLFLEYLPILAPFSFYCKVVWDYSSCMALLKGIWASPSYTLVLILTLAHSTV